MTWDGDSLQMSEDDGLQMLKTSKFNYPGWKTDKRLVEKHANSDSGYDVALYHLELMRRRQDVEDGSCKHPLYLQIRKKGLDWTYPESRRHVKEAVKYFKLGRDMFVQKVLKHGDRKEENFTKYTNGNSPREGGDSSRAENSGAHSPGIKFSGTSTSKNRQKPKPNAGNPAVAGSRRNADKGRRRARNENVIKLVIEPKHRKRMEDFNRKTLEMLRNAEGSLQEPPGRNNSSGPDDKNVIRDNQAPDQPQRSANSGKTNAANRPHRRPNKAPIHPQKNPRLSEEKSGNYNDSFIQEQQQRRRQQRRRHEENLNKEDDEDEVGSQSSMLLRRKEEISQGTCKHPLYIAIQERQWTHPDSESDKRAALRYFRFGQDSMTQTTLYIADRKDRGWKERKDKNNPRRVSIDQGNSNQSLNSVDSPATARLKDRLSKEIEHKNRRNASRIRRQRQESRSFDHPIYREIQRRAWTYPGNGEDKKAAKYYLEVGHMKMTENILKDGDIKEESYQYLQSGRRSHEILVELDSSEYSYPGWLSDKKLVEQTFIGKDRALRVLNVMTNKQNSYKMSADVPDTIRNTPPQGAQKKPAVNKNKPRTSTGKQAGNSTAKSKTPQGATKKKTTTKNSKARVQTRNKVGNGQTTSKLTKKTKKTKKKKTSWNVSDLRRPWNRW